MVNVARSIFTTAVIAAALFSSWFLLPAWAQEANYYCPALSVSLQRFDRDVFTDGQVSELQKFLASYFELDEEEIVTGFFGKITQGYVISFQEDVRLPSEGIVGPRTRQEIAVACGKEAPDGNVVSIKITPRLDRDGYSRGQAVAIGWESLNAPQGSVVAVDLIDAQTGALVGDGVVGKSQDDSGSYVWTVPPRDDAPLGYCGRAVDIPGVCGSDLVNGHYYKFRVTLQSDFECRGFCLSKNVIKYASDYSPAFTFTDLSTACPASVPQRVVCDSGEDLQRIVDGNGCLTGYSCKQTGKAPIVNCPAQPIVPQCRQGLEERVDGHNANGCLVSITCKPLSLSDAQKRDLQRVKDTAALKTALAEYFKNNGRYPSVAPDNQGPRPSYKDLANFLVPTYINALPHDPLSDKDPNWGDYSYIRGTEAESSYALWVRFEKGYPGYPDAVAQGGSCKAGINMNPGWFNPPGTLCPGEKNRLTRDEQRLNDTRQLKTALAAYFRDNGKYPSVAPDDQGPRSAYPLLEAYLVPKYLNTLPHDPLSSDPNWGDYSYIRGPESSKSYALWVRFENGYPDTPGVVAPGGSCKTGINMNPGWFNPPGTVCPPDINEGQSVSFLPAGLANALAAVGISPGTPVSMVLVFFGGLALGYVLAALIRKRNSPSNKY